MTSDSTLLSDQIFQLNTFLWAVADLPDEGSIRPVLRRAGYVLHAIGRKVQVPVGEAFRGVLKDLTGSADASPCRPDLWILKRTSPQLTVSWSYSARAAGQREGANCRPYPWPGTDISY